MTPSSRGGQLGNTSKSTTSLNGCSTNARNFSGNAAHSLHDNDRFIDYHGSSFINPRISSGCSHSPRTPSPPSELPPQQSPPSPVRQPRAWRESIHARSALSSSQPSLFPNSSP